MKKLYIFLFISFLILGCLFVYFSGWSIERKIGKRIDNCQPSNDCIIKIAEITDFQWDKMYVFDYGVSTDEIEKHLGIEYPDYIEFKRQLVFLKDGKIAYRENLLTSVSGAVDGAVEFSNLDYNHHLLLTPDTAIYKAQKYSPDGSKVVYFLKQTE